MGWIFKTPSDDSVEKTLRQLHIANEVDRVYERSWGWLKVIFFSCVTAFTISGMEHYMDWSLWDQSIEWLRVSFVELLDL